MFIIHNTTELYYTLLNIILEFYNVYNFILVTKISDIIFLRKININNKCNIYISLILFFRIILCFLQIFYKYF